jgi:hypothetical protein
LHAYELINNWFAGRVGQDKKLAVAVEHAMETLNNK